MNREEHNRIVQAGLKKMGVNFAKLEPSDLDRLIAQARQHSNLVRTHIAQIAAELRLAKRDINTRQLREECQLRYLDNFHRFDKDELLFILCTFLTLQTMEENGFGAA